MLGIDIMVYTKPGKSPHTGIVRSFNFFGLRKAALPVMEQAIGRIIATPQMAPHGILTTHGEDDKIWTTYLRDSHLDITQRHIETLAFPLPLPTDDHEFSIGSALETLPVNTLVTEQVPASYFLAFGAELNGSVDTVRILPTLLKVLKKLRLPLAGVLLPHTHNTRLIDALEEYLEDPKRDIISSGL